MEYDPEPQKLAAKDIYIKNIFFLLIKSRDAAAKKNRYERSRDK